MANARPLEDKDEQALGAYFESTGSRGLAAKYEVEMRKKEATEALTVAVRNASKSSARLGYAVIALDFILVLATVIIAWAALGGA